jgi:hypothetical protein
LYEHSPCGVIAGIRQTQPTLHNLPQIKRNFILCNQYCAINIAFLSRHHKNIAQFSSECAWTDEERGLDMAGQILNNIRFDKAGSVMTMYFFILTAISRPLMQ